MEEGWGRCDNGKFKREVRKDRGGYNWTGYGGWSNNHFPEYSVVIASSCQVSLPILLHLKLLTNKKILKKKKSICETGWQACAFPSQVADVNYNQNQDIICPHLENTHAKKVWYNGFRDSVCCRRGRGREESNPIVRHGLGGSGKLHIGYFQA